MATEAAELAGLLAANREFYRAFRARDMQAMERLWANHAPVACVHPGWNALLDRRSVLMSWQQILANPESPKIRIHRERGFLYGETGFVICQELLEQAVLVATNMFVKEEGAWRLVHHQSSPMATAMANSEQPPPKRLHS